MRMSADRPRQAVAGMLRNLGRPAASLAFVFMLAANPAPAQPYGTGQRPPTPKEQAYIAKHVTEVTHVTPSALAVARRVSERRLRVSERPRRGNVRSRGNVARLETSAAPLTASDADGTATAVSPSAVDNSTLSFFPPIRSQGSSASCAVWCTCYYFGTYTQARDEGYDVSGGDNAYIQSPGFMYPLVNDGRPSGANAQHVLTRLSDIGCGSWATMPFDPLDYTTWPTEAAWVEALPWRTSASHMIDGGSQAGLDAIKQNLANGVISVVGFAIYDTFYTQYPNDALGINNRVYYAPDGPITSSHAVTIVGYDDDRSYVDHRDGQTHYGAFLIANSWGPNWGWYNSTGSGTKGFFWVAYSMFIEHTFGPQTYYNTDRPLYRPKLYAVAGLNHQRRARLTYSGGIGPTAAPEFTGPNAIDRDGGTFYSITDAKRVAVDLTDGTYLFEPNVPKQAFVRLDVIPEAYVSGTITSADFLFDFDGDGVFEMVSSTDPTVTVAPGETGYATADVVYEPPPPFGIIAIERAAANPAWVEITWQEEPGMTHSVLWTADPPGGARTWDTLNGQALDDIVDNGNGTWTWTDKGTDPHMGGQAPGDVPARYYIVRAD